MQTMYVDVREVGEFMSSRVDGAINVPLSGLMQGDLSKLQYVNEELIEANSGKS